MTQITKEAIEAARAQMRPFIPPNDETLARALEAALPFLPIAVEGKVKELEWKQIEHLSWWCADCYRIEDGSDRPFYLRQRGLSGALITLGCFDTIEAAKAAAQADFETRILSALISSPGKDGGQEVEAVSDRGEPCPHCKGEGCQPGDPEGAPLEACDYCNGSGKKRDTHPAGTALVEALEALIAAVGDWSRPTGANGMVPASENHPLCVAAKQGREALAAGKETVNESVV